MAESISEFLTLPELVASFGKLGYDVVEMVLADQDTVKVGDKLPVLSTIITSNRDFGEWPSVFSNPLMSSAAMDRLVHHAVKFVIEGKSYRVESFSSRQQQLTAAT
jgi:hypothetical protein